MQDRYVWRCLAFVPLAWVPCSNLLAADAIATDTLDEVVISAGLRSEAAQTMPASVTVLDETTLRAAGVQHLEDVLTQLPNVSWAAGSSRPRFFLMRGIGEVEQYQGAPNPSVGFLIDDIDFSGMGMPATLFDTRQVEVLRGPQGTIYGANALAGLISVRTEDPTQDRELRAEATVGDFGTRALGVAAGDGSGNWAWRVAAQQYRSNGYRYNAFLGSDATNGYNEGTLRTKLSWQVGPALRADLTLMNVDLNNGYDAWSVDNSRVTLSNQPGRDSQQSLGAALKLSLSTDAFGEVRSVASAAHSRMLFSYDADWGNDAAWAACCGYSPYDYYEQDRRTRTTLAEDLRLLGDDNHLIAHSLSWLAGVYLQHMTEGDQLLDSWNDLYAGVGSNLLSSNYAATTMAAYGSVQTAMVQGSQWRLGVRVEQRQAHYEDSADLQTPFPSQSSDMVGGNLAWERRLAYGDVAYATLARGYKGGGFNIGEQIPGNERSFRPEYLWSLETGLKGSAGDAGRQWQADVFYMRRQDMQVYSSCQLQADNPATFVYFTRNASHGDNLGMEAQGSWRIDKRWTWSGTAALLRTRYLGYNSAALACSGATPLELDGRSQSFAPGYQLSSALDYQHPSGWFARLDVFATDGFYFAAGTNQTAQAYQLANIRVGVRRGPWEGSVWSRNVLNRNYAIQGFYFGLVPPNFSNQEFLQHGDPRTVGLTLRRAIEQ